MIELNLLAMKKLLNNLINWFCPPKPEPVRHVDEELLAAVFRLRTEVEKLKDRLERHERHDT